MPKERKSAKTRKKASKARKAAAPKEEVRSAADIAAERAAAMAEPAAGEQAASASEQEAPPSVEEAEAEEEPSAEPRAEVLPEVTVASLLKGTVELLAVQAWQHMGVQVSPQTGELRKDLPQARLAIDTAAAIVEKLQPQLTDDERRQYEGLVANLRINYVQRSNE